MRTLSFKEAHWETLLAFIQEGLVVPVIGSELTRIIDQETGHEVRLNDWLARKLTERLDLDPAPSLNALIRTILADQGTTRDVYPAIRNILTEASFEPTPTLRKLASITDFKGWLTTSFDGMLAKAITEERGRPPLELAYCPKRFEDLSPGVDLLGTELVYYLLGKLAPIARYAVGEEDLLEWITALQSDAFCPEKLMSEVQECHLLLLGVHYPDWLGRFFLRTAKRRRLSENREWSEFIVVPETIDDPELLDFLRSVSRNTIVVDGVENPADFVDELHRRWQAADPGRSPASSAGSGGAVRFQPPLPEMDDGVVFLSYSRGDLERVKRLKSGFDERGISAWFDLEALNTGDSYQSKIRRNIEQCSYFVPLISREALDRDEAFFYREWSWALDRNQSMGPGVVFILPVIIDDVEMDHPKIPDAFRDCDMIRLPEGQIDGRFGDRLAALLSAAHA